MATASFTLDQRAPFLRSKDLMDIKKPFLTSVAAHLYVSDVAASAEFFVGKLGFAIDFTYGDPPFYAQVRRNDAFLAIRHVHGPVFKEGVRDRDELISASITVDSSPELDQLCREFQTAQVSFYQLICEQPWGAKTFIVRDLDDNLILFAAPMI